MCTWAVVYLVKLEYQVPQNYLLYGMIADCVIIYNIAAFTLGWK